MDFIGTVGSLVLLVCNLFLQGNTMKSEDLPSGVLKALASNEKDYCDQFLGNFKKGCRQTFRSNLTGRQLIITPSGRTAILIENRNVGTCGSSGCSIYLFVQESRGDFLQILGDARETGTLESFKVLPSSTKDHYNIQKIWRDGKTKEIYQWDGRRYSVPGDMNPSPD